VDLQRQLPAQVGGIVDTGIQPLRCTTAVSVRRITTYEDALLDGEIASYALSNGIPGGVISVLCSCGNEVGLEAYNVHQCTSLNLTLNGRIDSIASFSATS
jgi:hypothetical protein